MIEQTLAIVKPDAAHAVTDALQAIRQEMGADTVIKRTRWVMMSLEQAEAFYAAHEGKSFYRGLIDHTISGAAFAIVLEGPNVIARWREVMGPTVPSPGQGLRGTFGRGVPDNAFHGSDSPEAARREIAIVFDGAADAPARLRFKKLTSDAILPARQTGGAAGLDVFALSDGVVKHGEVTRVHTGLAIAVPDGYEIQVRARSGLAANEGIMVVNGPGTVDSDFRGELVVLLTRCKQDRVAIGEQGEGIVDDPYTFKAGHRIAQLVLARVAPVEVVEVDTLDETARGAGGWGHTGK